MSFTASAAAARFGDTANYRSRRLGDEAAAAAARFGVSAPASASRRRRPLRRRGRGETRCRPLRQPLLRRGGRARGIEVAILDQHFLSAQLVDGVELTGHCQKASRKHTSQ